MIPTLASAPPAAADPKASSPEDAKAGHDFTAICQQATGAKPAAPAKATATTPAATAASQTAATGSDSTSPDAAPEAQAADLQAAPAPQPSSLDQISARADSATDLAPTAQPAKNTTAPITRPAAATTPQSPVTEAQVPVAVRPGAGTPVTAKLPEVATKAGATKDPAPSDAANPAEKKDHATQSAQGQSQPTAPQVLPMALPSDTARPLQTAPASRQKTGTQPGIAAAATVAVAAPAASAAQPTTAAPTGTTPALAPEGQELLSTTTAGLASAGGGTAKLTLHPQTLGTVTVEVTVTSAGVTSVRMEASTEAGRQALSATSGQLAQHLGAAGLAVGSIQTSGAGFSQPLTQSPLQAQLPAQAPAAPVPTGGSGSLAGGFQQQAGQQGGQNLPQSPDPQEPFETPTSPPTLDRTVKAYA